MPVIPPAIPAAVKKAYLDGVADFYATEPQLVNAVRASADKIKGLPVFAPTPDQLYGVTPIDFDQSVGWRVFARTPYEAVAADVVVASNGSARVTSFTRGKALTQMIDTVLTTLTTANLPAGENYDPYLFRLSGTYVEACCLKSKSGGPNLYIPTISGLSELTRGKRYESNVFLGAMKKFDDECKPSEKKLV